MLCCNHGKGLKQDLCAIVRHNNAEMCDFLSTLIHRLELVTLTVSYIIPLQSNLFCLIKQQCSRNNLQRNGSE